MNITFKARNMEVSGALKEYATKRLSKFDRLIKAEDATVSMTMIKDRYRLEVTIPYSGIIIRGEEEGYDLYASIDNVTAKLESQLHKYRTRLIKKGRGEKPQAAEAVTAHAAYAEDDQPVKVKHFITKPMPVDEAIMQMNLLGHGFFVFINSEDANTVNVLYRRNDGEYGLLVPEV
ncbi:MAG: ribosome-associated translation inhibitor RaiA [Clostridiales bacterium]|nr:ribosome-associated translation inhibitor RaiA [Clostridiales bacterium]